MPELAKPGPTDRQTNRQTEIAIAICHLVNTKGHKKKKTGDVSVLTMQKSDSSLCLKVRDSNSSEQSFQPGWLLCCTFHFDLTPFLKGSSFFEIAISLFLQWTFSFRLNRNNSYHSWISVRWLFFLTEQFFLKPFFEFWLVLALVWSLLGCSCCCNYNEKLLIHPELAVKLKESEILLSLEKVQ